MQRLVSAHLEADVLGVSDVVLSIAVAAGSETLQETLTVTIDGHQLTPTEITGPHGARLHVLGNGPLGRMIVDYEATVGGQMPVQVVEMIDRLTYLRPSRYCESDRLGAFAYAEFGLLSGHDLIAAVSNWVGVHVQYVLGSSGPTDGAMATLLSRQGVCRDFAHLVVALLRARDTPARVVSVYAPGLSPMDFHAVAEAYVDGAWHVVDPTLLAPRSTMVRISTGRDAADTAFLTNRGGSVNLWAMQVSAVVNPTLPAEHFNELILLR